MMLDFLNMLGNVEERKVARHEYGQLFISTVRVTDSPDFPFETAIAHPDYDDGQIIIVESYKTKDQALSGHAKWLNLMTCEPLPDFLCDAGKNTIGQMNRDIGNESRFPRKKK